MSKGFWIVLIALLAIAAIVYVTMGTGTGDPASEDLPDKIEAPDDAKAPDADANAEAPDADPGETPAAPDTEPTDESDPSADGDTEPTATLSAPERMSIGEYSVSV